MGYFDLFIMWFTTYMLISMLFCYLHPAENRCSWCADFACCYRRPAAKLMKMKCVSRTLRMLTGPIIGPPKVPTRQESVSAGPVISNIRITRACKAAVEIPQVVLGGWRMMFGESRADGQRFFRRHVDVRLFRDLMHNTRGFTINNNNSHTLLTAELHWALSLLDFYCSCDTRRTRARGQRFWFGDLPISSAASRSRSCSPAALLLAVSISSKSTRPLSLFPFMNFSKQC